MAAGISCAVVMMMTLTMFGMMCFWMIRLAEAPMDFAARTYSFSLMVRICPRTSRAMPTQYRRPKTMNMDTMFVPRFANNGICEKSRDSLKTTARRMMIRRSGRE